MKKKPSILIVDDDKALLGQLQIGLDKHYLIATAENVNEAMQMLSSNKYDLLLLDLHLPPSPHTPSEGFKLLEKIKNKVTDMLTVVITGNDEKENALKAIEKGAYDYFTKPFNPDELEIVLRRAFTKLKLEIENKRLRYQLKHRTVDYQNIIGRSKTMNEVYDLIKAAADSQANILVTGESGTGKELVARAIHNASTRRKMPFMVINCAALSESLLEDELFGHEKGAYTGAASQRKGRFELANYGTVFLDEISSISPKLQATLLRVIQEKEIERLGSSHTIKVDVRIISATNQPLETLIEKRKIREDFYYRINVFTVNLPALRDKKDDILLLTNHFIDIYNIKNKKRVKGITKDALKTLELYHWPGNVRELENVIERAVIIAGHREIDMQDLPEYITSKEMSPNIEYTKGPVKLNEYISKIEKTIIEQRLKANKNNKKLTAEELHLTYRQLKYLCEKYKL